MIVPGRRTRFLSPKAGLFDKSGEPGAKRLRATARLTRVAALHGATKPGRLRPSSSTEHRQNHGALRDHRLTRSGPLCVMMGEGGTPPRSLWPRGGCFIWVLHLLAHLSSLGAAQGHPAYSLRRHLLTSCARATPGTEPSGALRKKHIKANRRHACRTRPFHINVR